MEQSQRAAIAAKASPLLGARSPTSALSSGKTKPNCIHCLIVVSDKICLEILEIYEKITENLRLSETSHVVFEKLSK